MPRKRVGRKKPKQMVWLPLVAAVGVSLGWLMAYIGAETLLSARVHPLHWLVAAAGALVGYLVGLVWYWRRGDIG